VFPENAFELRSGCGAKKLDTNSNFENRLFYFDEDADVIINQRSLFFKNEMTKYITASSVVLALMSPVFAFASADTLVCHATGSDSNPTVEINVNFHAADSVPGTVGSCEGPFPD